MAKFKKKFKVKNEERGGGGSISLKEIVFFGVKCQKNIPFGRFGENRFRIRSLEIRACKAVILYFTIVKRRKKGTKRTLSE